MLICSQTRSMGCAIISFACVLLIGISSVSAVPDSGQSRLELQLIASSERVRVWDCLLLKYIIRNNTAADVVPDYFTEYIYGKVTIELRREPENIWRPYQSHLAKAFEERSSFGPGLTVARGTARFDLANLFHDERWQPVFATPGIYHLQVCIPFQDHGLVKSEPIRIQVVDIPAEERQFIEQDRRAFSMAVYGGLVVNNDLDGMYQIEGRLSHSQNRSLLRYHILLLEQFRKRGFRVDDDCKRLLARLRKEYGDITADFCTLNLATHFSNQKQWSDASELLSTVPGHSTQKEALMNGVRNRGR